MSSGRPKSQPASPAPRKVPREWVVIQPRVRLVALRLQRKAERMQRRGAKVFELTADNLVQHSWLCLNAQKPPFDPSRQTLFQYFRRRMEDEFKRIVDRAENAPSVTYFELTTTGYLPEDGGRVIDLADARNEARAFEMKDTLDALMRWLERNHPDLHRLAQIIDEHDAVDPQEQATHLGVPITKVYELRRRLKQAAERFTLMTNKDGDA